MQDRKKMDKDLRKAYPEVRERSLGNRRKDQRVAMLLSWVNWG